MKADSEVTSVMQCNKPGRMHRTKSGRRKMLIALAGMLSLMLAMGASTKIVLAADAVNTITLTYASAEPPSHSFSIPDIEWIKKVEKESGGRLKIKPYWAGSLIGLPTAYTELVNGVADIALFFSAFTREGFDLDKVITYGYFGVSNPEVARRIFYELWAKYPELKKEYTGVKVLATHSITPYNVGTVKKAIRKIEDFGGLSLKATGVHIKVLAKLKAEGIAVPMGETYLAMQKNTIDGALFPMESLSSWKFAEVVKYYTLLNMATGPNPHRGMNWASWNKLPPDLQKVLENNVEWWGKRIDEEMVRTDEVGKRFAMKEGTEIINFTPEELAKFYDIVDSVVLEEAERLKAKGFDNAVEIYKYTRELVKKYK
jgi:TRAP-type C4-dicarboxylate transport system substrate-binding protein